jgi:seryl-tRNA synthetase
MGEVIHRTQEDEQNGLSKLFTNSEIDGLYGRHAPLELVVGGINAALDAHRPAEAEVLNFPPVMSRSVLDKCGYLINFPHLAASVHEFCATGPAAQRSLSERPTEIVLTPAACYPIYPAVAERGPVPPSGLCFDTACFCFRREPSRSLDRLQAFRMREFVNIGEAENVLTFRDTWIPAMEAFSRSLGFAPSVVPASDPFFGRMAPFLSQSQREQSLKYELVLPIVSNEEPTAIFSFNYHQDHFGQIFQLRMQDGSVAHSACVATGVDRLALALFKRHGLELKEWPEAVLKALKLDHC